MELWNLDTAKVQCNNKTVTMGDLKQWFREASEMQTWQWNYGTLTLHKVQCNNGTVTMEDLKQWPQETSEMQTWQWNYGTLTLHKATMGLSQWKI